MPKVIAKRMRAFSLCILLPALAVLVASPVRSQLTDHQELRPTEHGRVRVAVAAAIERGDAAVTLQPAIGLPTGITTVDEILAEYSVMLVEPSRVVVSTNDADQIATWYKLKVLEVLKLQQQGPADDLPESVPEELLPVRDDEVLFAESGGHAMIDGVIVTQQSLGNLFLVPGTKYLLFVHLEFSGKFVSLAAYTDGAFAVQPDGRLVGFSRGDRPLVEEVERRYGNNIKNLREEIRRRLR